ncbi:MAG: SDR family oxidoreductase [Pirellulales bacterium]
MSRESSNAAQFVSSLFGLEGQVAAVVGAAGRIGRVLSRALASAGAQVCLLDLDGDAAALLAGEISASSGRRALGLAADATDPGSLDEAVRRIGDELGPPRLLVNSAQYRGAGFYSSRVEDYPLAAWEKVIQVNLTGVHLACQAFGRSMAEHGGGSIVNIASTYALVSPDPRIYGDSGVNSPVSYAAAKAGVVNLTRYLAVHWREQHIRVNCLAPGGVFDDQEARFVEQYCQRTPLGRMARAEDYQGAVLFMLSAASAYMTGAVVTVDGGWTAW